MSKMNLDQRVARRSGPDGHAGPQAGALGVARVPPAYGLEVVDSGPATQVDVVQRRAASARLPQEAPPAKISGLPNGLKTSIEGLSGVTLDDVRVHFNSSRPAQLNALAYTQGSEIHIAPGQERYLPHEAWHVVQQRQGKVKPTLQLKQGIAVNDDAALEREADVMGAKVVQRKHSPQTASSDQLGSAQADSQAAEAHYAGRAVGEQGGSGPRTAGVVISAPITASRGSYRLVAGAGGRQVGSLMVQARDQSSIEVTDLGVERAYREQGIGKTLIAAAARTALQLGKEKVGLAAQDSGSGRLTQWYKGMGFAEVGVNESGYPHLEAPIGRVLAAQVPRKSPSVRSETNTLKHTRPQKTSRLIQRMKAKTPTQPVLIAAYTNVTGKKSVKMNSGEPMDIFYVETVSNRRTSRYEVHHKPNATGVNKWGLIRPDKSSRKPSATSKPPTRFYVPGWLQDACLDYH